MAAGMKLAGLTALSSCCSNAVSGPKSMLMTGWDCASRTGIRCSFRRSPDDHAPAREQPKNSGDGEDDSAEGLQEQSPIPAADIGLLLRGSDGRDHGRGWLNEG